MMYSNLRITGILLAATAFAGCSTATSHTVDVEYRNPAYEAVSFENVAVIVLVEDRSERIANESVIAERLDAFAVNASATFDLMPNILTVESEAAAREAFAGTDFDAILTIAAVKSREEYSRGTAVGTYFIAALLGADSRQARSAAILADSADYYGSGKLVLDIGLWDVETMDPVWDATTDSYEFDRGADAAKNFADFVIQTLVARGFITP